MKHPSPTTITSAEQRLVELEREWDAADATGRPTRSISSEIAQVENILTELKKQNAIKKEEEN